MYLTNDLIEEILDNIGFEDFAQLVKKLQADEIVDVLEDLDENQIKELLEFFPGDMGRVIREILSYPEESAGRLIHKDFIVAPESWTIERVLQFIRMQKNLPKHINEIFVVDDFNKPIGSITLNSILRAKSRMQVKDVMEKDIKIIKTGEDQEDVAFWLSYQFCSF